MRGVRSCHMAKHRRQVAISILVFREPGLPTSAPLDPDIAGAEIWTLIDELMPPDREGPVAAVRDGLPYATLERLRNVLGVSDDLLARVLGTSERTLARGSRRPMPSSG